MAAIFKLFKRFFPSTNSTEIFRQERLCKIMLESIKTFGCYRSRTPTHPLTHKRITAQYFGNKTVDSRNNRRLFIHPESTPTVSGVRLLSDSGFSLLWFSNMMTNDCRFRLR